jgi:enoyl-[acyl-carrier-protein] reductase (NADH)
MQSPPGPIKTLAARGVSDFATILDAVTARAPLHRNIEQQEVGKVALFLASDLASGMTRRRNVRGLRFQYHWNLRHEA